MEWQNHSITVFFLPAITGVLFYLIKKAAVCACVTGGAGLLHLYQQRIVIAIAADGYHPLKVSRGLALVPQLLAGAAEKPCVSRFQRFLQALAVHICEHKHLAGRFLLDNRRNKLAFYKEFIQLHGFTSLRGYRLR